MKKCFALFLALLLALMAPMALAEEPVVEPQLDELVVGSTTALSGSFFTDMWGRNTADMDVRALLYGYDLVEWKNDMGTFGLDETVVSGILGTIDGDGNRSYSLALHEDLFYSDGTPITAWDYAFSILLSIAPEIAEIGGAVTGSDHIIGIDEYRSGESNALAGVRVEGDYMLTIDVKAEYYPYFYEMALLNYKPYPISVIAPGCMVADDGEGVYIRNIDETIEEPIFTAELLQETILNPETGYRSHPSVVSGPYCLTAFDGETAEFEINEFYKGNSMGEKPMIPRIVFKSVQNETAIEQLANGEIGLLNKCVNANTVDAGMQQVMQQTAAVSNYARSGYSFISFCCEQPATSSAAVRQAIAKCFDKETFIQNYVRNYGLRVDGYYGIGQWMYRVVTGALPAPVAEPEAGADEAAVAAYGQQQMAWAELNQRWAVLNARWTGQSEVAPAAEGMEPIVVEVPDVSPVDLLVEDGWTLNREGEEFDPEQDDVRCKEINGEIVPLDLKLIYPEGNTVGEFLQTTLVDKLKPVGIALTVEARPFNDLLQVYYRQQERDCEMIYLATNFASVFEPSSTFSPLDAFQGEDNRTGINDEKLYQLALDLRATDPADVYGYCEKWVTLQEYWDQVMPSIPVYSNVYFDFYTPYLQNYNVGAETSWAEAIVGAYLSDAVMMEVVPAEDAAVEEDGLVTFD